MTLWEFSIAVENGVTTGQILIAAGLDEAFAAADALAVLNLSPGAALVRPGALVGPDAEAGWMSLCGPQAFPLVVQTCGRTARYARGG